MSSEKIIIAIVTIVPKGTFYESGCYCIRNKMSELENYCQHYFKKSIFSSLKAEWCHHTRLLLKLSDRISTELAMKMQSINLSEKQYYSVEVYTSLGFAFKNDFKIGGHTLRRDEQVTQKIPMLLMKPALKRACHKVADLIQRGKRILLIKSSQNISGK